MLISRGDWTLVNIEDLGPLRIREWEELIRSGRLVDLPGNRTKVLVPTKKEPKQ